LSVSSPQKTLYALTDSGLWEHHLQAFPGPASYPQHDLLLHWLTIVLITVIASAAGIAALRQVCRRTEF
jgi:hypothetical protein